MPKQQLGFGLGRNSDWMHRGAAAPLFRPSAARAAIHNHQRRNKCARRDYGFRFRAATRASEMTVRADVADPSRLLVGEPMLAADDNLRRLLLLIDDVHARPALERHAALPLHRIRRTPIVEAGERALMCFAQFGQNRVSCVSALNSASTGAATNKP